MLKVSLNNYAVDLRLLHHAVVDRGPSDRGNVRPGVQTVTIEVAVDRPLVSKAARITVFLRGSDLYLLGFANDAVKNKGQGWFFSDHVGSGLRLAISGSYVGPASIGIFNGSEVSVREEARERGRYDLANSIELLSRFTGDRQDEIKLALADVALIVSESLRFMTVFQRLIAVFDEGKTFRYKDFRDDIQNWQDKSAPGHPERWKIRTYQG